MRLWTTWLILIFGLVLSIVFSLLAGEGHLSNPDLKYLFLELRTYRFSASFLAGAALATGGVLMQGVFQNPLASPSILGTTAGASLGGAFVIILWDLCLAQYVPSYIPSELVLPFGCILGALIAMTLLLTVAGRYPSILSLLLTGFILSSFFLSLSGLLTSFAQESWELGRAMVTFTLGGVEGKGPAHIALAIPMTLGGLLAAYGWGQHLDVLLAGEDEATSLGVNVRLLRRWLIIWTAVLTASAVVLGGNISFVGLVVPHMLRFNVGVQHRQLLPAAFIGGGIFVSLADTLTRMAPTQANIPLGVVTGIIGAPVFLWLLARQSHGASAS